ncbi:hypothetical protein [Priestia aryabhattai]|uniref:hypothetical protein n=1 Tax=Priestia aryabhattai TaxID=412384 RepID=UPI001ADA106E|nr:hypothetical protein [Priestia aryabhattai]QTL48027.1 hypothetical protein J5Z55_18330 [Priestia aryabhattai]
MSKLLLKDQPLIVLPALAVKVGVNGALFLQQLHYWLEKSVNVQDGYTWVYNTNQQWLQQFPFWSLSTIQRIISKLEKEGLIIKGKYNRSKFNNTVWYRIDYAKLEKFMPSDEFDELEDVNLTERNSQIEAAEPVTVTASLTETTAKNTNQIKSEEAAHDAYVQTLEAAFIARRKRGVYPSASDLKHMYEVAKSEIPVEEALAGLHEAFDHYAPKYSGDTIRAFAYIKQHLFHKHYLTSQRTLANQQTEKPLSYANKKRVIRKELTPDWLRENEETAPSAPAFKDDVHFEEEKKKLAESLRELERELKNN